MTHIIYPELFFDKESIIRYMMNIVVNDYQSSFILSSSFISRDKVTILSFSVDSCEPGRLVFFTEELKQKFIKHFSSAKDYRRSVQERTFDTLLWSSDGSLDSGVTEIIEEFKKKWDRSGLTKFNEYRIHELRDVIEMFFISEIKPEEMQQKKRGGTIL